MRYDTTHTAYVSSDQRAAELVELAASEGVKLPMPVTLILWFEDRGYIVNLHSGLVTAPVVSLPTPSVRAVAHLLTDYVGGLS